MNNKRIISSFSNMYVYVCVLVTLNERLFQYECDFVCEN